MSSSSWKDLYREGYPVSIGYSGDIDKIKAIIRAKELAKEIDKDFWVYKAGVIYWAYERYPGNQTPIAHVYPAGRVEWRVK